jgi:myosin-5
MSSAFRPDMSQHFPSNYTSCAVQIIDSQIENQEDDNACVAYWLTNTVTLLFLLRQNTKPVSRAKHSAEGGLASWRVA